VLDHSESTVKDLIRNAKERAYVQLGSALAEKGMTATWLRP
jgi:hypothetical protein